jgi:hypothetical protein
LSLLALLSGLCVLFPLDNQYGWDLAHPEHQRLITELEMDLGDSEPDVLLASPSFGHGQSPVPKEASTK